MQIPNSFRRVAASAILPLILGLPLPSAAATASPQTVLNRALMNEWTGQAASMDMTLNIGLEQKPLKKTDPAGSGSVALRLQTRVLPVPANRLTGDSEGRFSIEKLAMNGLDMDMPVQLDGPLSVQWKLAERTAYFRLENVPQSLLDYLKQMGETDYSVLVGRWIKLDLDSELPASGSAILNGDDARTKRIKQLAVTNPPLLVNRVESRTKSADGHERLRMRLIVNPRFITALYNEALKEIPRTPANTRATQIKALNTLFAQIRTNLARTGMVAVVDATANRLVRFEIGGRYPSPMKDCSYNFTSGKQVCKTTGTQTVTVAAGVNIKSDAGAPIEIPANALDKEGLEALLDSLRPEQPLRNEPVEEDSAIPFGLEPVGSADHVLGSANPRVNIITYSDFQCPSCRSIEPDLKRLLTEFPLDTRLVYRHYPLSMHAQAMNAANASECAAYVGGPNAFWQMATKLFENQATLGLDQYPIYATQIGLDRTAFSRCMESTVMTIRINRDLESASLARVDATPTTFFNGTKVVGAVSYEELRAAAVAAGAAR